MLKHQTLLGAGGREPNLSFRRSDGIEGILSSDVGATEESVPGKDKIQQPGSGFLSPAQHEDSTFEGKEAGLSE